VPVESRAARHRIFRSAEPLLVFSLKNNNYRRGQLRRLGTRASRLGFCHPERSEGSTRSDSPVVSRFKQASALARLLASLREDSSASLLRNRAYAQSSREQGCDKLSILLNGITTSVSPMVLSQHPMNHARKRARGTNAKFGLGPRVRSVYQVAPVSSMVCRGSARVTCSE
jgi:hypothetical protein